MATETCARIDTHDRRGEKFFQVEDEGKVYWIDTEQFTQKDPDTGAQWPLRSVVEGTPKKDKGARLGGLSSRGSPPCISINSLRPPRLQAYMAGEWKNLPDDVAEEVGRWIAQGETVFTCRAFSELDAEEFEATEYQFDLNAMTETNVRTGRCWRLRRLDACKAVAPPGSPSLSVSRKLGLNSDGSLQALRQSFKDYDVARTGKVSARDILGVWTQWMSKLNPGRTLGSCDVGLLQETVVHFEAHLRLRKTCNHITVAHWVHYWLLHASSPNAAANAVLNDKLGVWQAKDPQALSRLIEMFEQADVHHRKALTPAQLRAACVRAKTIAPKDSLVYHGARKFLDEGGYVQDNPSVSYYEFLGYMLGRRKEEVYLYCYDIANGKAPLLAPLVGEYWEGVWHTGIVAFGKEYWYGGRLFESVPGSTAFGSPHHIEHLGTTLRTKDELWELLTRELARQYTGSNYDVLNHNCNHFTDELSRFLLNEPLPKHIVSQGEAVMQSPLLRVVSPVLNYYLGRFDGAEGGRSADEASAEKVWNEVTVGSLVLYTPHDGAIPVVAEVLNREGGICDVRWLEIQTMEIVEGQGVTKAQVKPLGSSTGRRVATPLSGTPMRAQSFFGCVWCPVN